MNKDTSNNTLAFIANVDDFISLRLKKTIKIINDDKHHFISKCYSYVFSIFIILIVFNMINSE